jgi:O-antigen/teichoic acid export membrane protein
VPQAYARALYPLLSRLRHEDNREFERLSRDSIVWMVVTTMPLSIATFSLAPWIITILYGDHMSAAIRGLQITAWLLIPYALTNTLAQILFASGNQALDLRVNAAAVLANLTLNLVLIPHWGFVGAASASLASIMLHVGLQYRYVRQRIFDPAVLPTLARIGVVGLISCLLTTTGIAIGYDAFLATSLGLSCYVLGLWAAGIVHREHLRILRAHAATASGKLFRDRSARALDARHPPAVK